MRFMALTAILSMMASAEPWHPKRFEAAVAESHRGYHPRKFLADGPKADERRKALALVGEGKTKKSKGPWDWNNDEDGSDEYEYGEHAEDMSADPSSEYAISHFIKTDENDQ